jgi:hypothetical protein
MNDQLKTAVQCCDLQIVTRLIKLNGQYFVSNDCWYNLGVLSSDEKKTVKLIQLFLLYSDPPSDSRFWTNKFKGLIEMAHKIRERAAQLVQESFDEELKSFPTSVAGIVASFLPNHEIRQKALQ